MLAIFSVADLGWNNAPNESTGLKPSQYEALRPDTTDETVTLLKSKLKVGVNRLPPLRPRFEHPSETLRTVTSLTTEQAHCCLQEGELAEVVVQRLLDDGLERLLGNDSRQVEDCATNAGESNPVVALDYV